MAMSSPPSISTISHLEYLINNYPLIDNHAHPLLNESHANAYPLESITSEAHGDSLIDAKCSLAHRRAVKQLSAILDCDPTWEAIKEERQKLDASSWTATCFSGIQCVLFDDGLDKETVLGYREHDQFTLSPNKRIVRIEKLAEEVMQSMLEDENFHSTSEDIDGNQDVVLRDRWRIWSRRFEELIADALVNPEVVGFKSVICYRTGLEIEARIAGFHVPSASQVQLASVELDKWIRGIKCENNSGFRLQNKFLNDWVVSSVCEALDGEGKPLQFHTGLGDNDINLLKSNPAHMQEFIKKYPEVQFVLLHSSYPYTREAGYLAAVYKNVYLDFGEVFPMLSKDGQKSVIKQILELTPYNKLLWSSDGHWFPETYILANIQIREVMCKVMIKRVKSRDLDLNEAADIVKMLFFENSNHLYNLGLDPDLGDWFNSLNSPQKPISEVDVRSDGKAMLESFLEENPEIDHLRIQWLDHTTTLRLRVIPRAVVLSKIEKSWDISITQASLSLLHDDTPTPDMNAEGKYLVVPDWNSLRKCTFTSGHAAVMCYLRKAESTYLDICTRTALLMAVRDAERKYGIDFLVGFETQVVFSPQGLGPRQHEAHAWSCATALTLDYQKLMDEIMKALTEAGIDVLMYHSGSADGQWEIVTGPLPPMAAVDTLYHTRETIRNIAAKHHLHATLHPKVYPKQIGTAAHTHFSLGRGKKHQNSFVAGILQHLQAICAFGLPSLASYLRTNDNFRSGGKWVCWGHENRSAPLRRISSEEAHWEIRCVDGTANMYLFLTAVIRAGLVGIEDSYQLPPTVTGNPDNMSPEDLATQNITQSLPESLGEALNMLQSDEKLVSAMGLVLCRKYTIVKRAEEKHLGGFWQEHREKWELAHY